MTYRLFFLSTLTLFICIVANASIAETSATKPIKIGVVQSLTGIAAEDGKTVVQALMLAAEDLNAQGEGTIELLIEDDATQPKNSVSALEKLASQHVEAVIGATWDFTTNAILAAASKKQLPVFNTSTLLESIAISKTNGFGFINAISAHDEALAFKQYLTKKSPRSMAVVFANNSWGETQREVYQDVAIKAGVTIAEEFRSTSIDTNEWNTFIAKLKHKKIDLTLLLLNKNDLEIFLRRSSELEFASAFFASKNLFDAYRATNTKSLYENVCFTYPLAQLRTETEFRDRYRAIYNEEARIYADNSYDALFIVAKAVQLSRKNSIALKDAIKAVTHSGVAGEYKFSAQKSFSQGKTSLVCIHAGDLAVDNIQSLQHEVTK